MGTRGVRFRWVVFASVAALGLWCGGVYVLDRVRYGYAASRLLSSGATVKRVVETMPGRPRVFVADTDPPPSLSQYYDPGGERRKALNGELMYYRTLAYPLVEECRYTSFFFKNGVLDHVYEFEPSECGQPDTYWTFLVTTMTKREIWVAIAKSAAIIVLVLLVSFGVLYWITFSGILDDWPRAES
jgi:hypothetical protein